MSQPLSEHSIAQSTARHYRFMQACQHLWHVLAIVLLPLLLLTGSGVGTLGLIVLVRTWTASDAFFVRQLLLLLAVTLGLLLAVLTYTVSIVFALRKIRAWHESNQAGKAHGATWGLGFTALMVALPLLLALFLH